MGILFMGTEDDAFQGGGAALSALTTTSGYYRSSWSRGALKTASTGATNFAYSNTFIGGAVTSAWFQAQLYQAVALRSFDYCCFGLTTTANLGRGIYLGVNLTTIKLFKWDGTTLTTLASESGTSFALTTLNSYTVNLQNYGASSTINVYAAGGSSPIITFSGDCRVTGVTNFDTFALGSAQGGSAALYISECVVADIDTRTLNIKTHTMSAIGDANAWTGTYTDVNEASINDATMIYTNSTNQDCQFNIDDLPTGTWGVICVGVSARAAHSVGSTATQIGLSFKSGGTINNGTAQSPGTSYGPLMALYSTNPVTSAAWTQSSLNSAQFNAHSS
jgi:hypothetical protein